jgi:CDP-diacylglycerol--serine O-phosphatidyltransferase
VTIVVGDKTANDFYIPPEQPFTTIGALPYLYEANLRRFCKAHQDAVDRGLLDLHLWRHDPHSFHLKGLLVDDDYALLTGSNLNPRAWRLDLENGLLIDDPQGCLLRPARGRARTNPAHTRRLDHHSALDAPTVTRCRCSAFSSASPVPAPIACSIRCSDACRRFPGVRERVSQVSTTRCQSLLGR